MEFKKDSKDNPFSKPMFELIDPRFLDNMARVLTHGANKYGLYNWKTAKLNELHHYLGASFRHLNKYASGEGLDPETNLPHLAHLSVNAMFLDWFRYNKIQWGTTY